MGDCAPLTRRGQRLRLSAAVAVLALLGWGSAVGTDQAFPVGPFLMFAGTTPDDGEIRTARLEAVTVEGRRLEVPLEPEVVGVRRAEVEGQLDRLVREPELLGSLAGAAARLRPDQPAWQRVELRQTVVQLRGGREVQRDDVLLADWQRTDRPS